MKLLYVILLTVVLTIVSEEIYKEAKTTPTIIDDGNDATKPSEHNFMPGPVYYFG